MSSIELPDDERAALEALHEKRKAHPEADYFEHDRQSVRMPGAAQDVDLKIDRETLRRLGHRNLIEFMPGELSKGRWIFDLTARASDYV